MGIAMAQETCMKQGCGEAPRMHFLFGLLVQSNHMSAPVYIFSVPVPPPPVASSGLAVAAVISPIEAPSTSPSRPVTVGLRDFGHTARCRSTSGLEDLRLKVPPPVLPPPVLPLLLPASAFLCRPSTLLTPLSPSPCSGLEPYSRPLPSASPSPLVLLFPACSSSLPL